MENIDWLYQPWPWYVGGALIGIMVPALLIISNKQFGISSSLQHMCAACLPTGALDYFKYNVKEKGLWNMVFIVGMLIGGYLAGNVFANPEPVALSESTVEKLEYFGISHGTGLIPSEIFNWENVLSLQGLIVMVFGGFLVGFGARYANGCTSGHAIMGMSLLNIGSLIAVIGFFIGGLIVAHLVLPFILTL